MYVKLEHTDDKKQKMHSHVVSVLVPDIKSSMSNGWGVVSLEVEGYGATKEEAYVNFLESKARVIETLKILKKELKDLENG